MIDKQFYSEKNEVSLFWVGNDGWIINLYGTIIATDLDLFSCERVPLPVNVDFDEMIRNVQIYIVTHAHGDHFNDETAQVFAEKSNCKFVIPKSCMDKAELLGIRSERIITAEKSKTVYCENTAITPFRAVHGHISGSVYSGASLEDCGYLIEKNGFRIFQPGDTLLLEEHLELNDIDIAFVSPTEHNMCVKQSVIYITSLEPQIIIPQHYASYIEAPDNLFWTHGYTDELYAALPEKYKARFTKLEQGQLFTVKENKHD